MNDFASAGIANAIQMIVGYPLDTAKIWIQSGQKQSLSFRHLYGGIKYPLVGHSAMTALCFSIYDYGIRQSYHPIVSGLASGSLVSVIIVPFEIMKITKQYEPNSQIKQMPRLFWKCLPSIYARETSYITIILNLQHWFHTKTDISPVVYGAICSSVSWIATYPLDIYKTNTILHHSLGKKMGKHALFDRGIAYSIGRVSLGGSIFMTVYSALRE
jgi:hypothetical protein